MATSCAVIAVSFLSFPGMAEPWVSAWARQREVLETIKRQPFPRELQPGDIVLGDLPSIERDVPVFGAPWSATAAMMIAWADVIPGFALQNPSPVTIMSFDGDFNMAWQPGKLTIKPGWEMAGKRLWLWRWKTGEAVLVKSASALPRDGFNALFEANR